MVDIYVRHSQQVGNDVFHGCFLSKDEKYTMYQRNELILSQYFEQKVKFGGILYEICDCIGSAEVE